MNHEPPPPPADGLAVALAMIGIQVRPEHFTQILGWVPILGAAALTLWGVLAKVRSDKQTTITDALRQDNATLRGELAQAKLDNRQLEADKDKAEEERDDARAELRVARNTDRDKDELISAFARDLAAAHNAIESGAPPPPPTVSWRVTEHLAARTIPKED